MTFPREKLEGAGYLFERSHGNRLGAYETSVIEEAGLSSAGPSEVADAIWGALTGPMSREYRLAAYWALGKLGRKGDKQKLVTALRREVQEDVQVAYQILIALDNMDEPVFSRSGVSYDEDELNLRDAMAYLESQK